MSNIPINTEAEFVIKRNITMPDRGICYFTTNSEIGRDCHSYKGELWYENVGYANTVEEAQDLVAKHTTYPLASDVYKYFLGKE